MVKLEKYLQCIKCFGDLKFKNNTFVCKSCNQKYTYNKGIFGCMELEADEKLFSQQKWDKFYDRWFKNKEAKKEYDKVKDMYMQYGTNQVKKYYKLTRESVYFELGCGAFIIGTQIAKDCKLVVGIDFSLPALIAAKKILDLNKVKNYLLIHGDIFKIPLKKQTIDLLYGGGVIEHFKDTKGCISEYSRIMKKGGVALNAVPMLNIGSLTYRQFWGNIPDFPILKQLAEFVHIKILGGKHMVFGYEMSFTKSKLKKLHEKCGFRKINFVRLDTEVMMDYLPKFMKPAMVWLATNSSWFWPMMMVVAKK